LEIDKKPASKKLRSKVQNVRQNSHFLVTCG